MTDSHASEHHAGPGFQAYMVVFGALSIFTAISFLVILSTFGGMVLLQRRRNRGDPARGRRNPYPTFQKRQRI